MAWIASPLLQHLLIVLGTLALTGADEIRVPPSIVSPIKPQQLIYSENDKVEVKCNATGQPAPSYKWLWNGYEIQSEYITFSESTGVLTIDSLTTREEGLFVCYASNTFSNGMTATAASATLEIRVGRVEDFLLRPLEAYTGTEGNYITIPCDKNLPTYYGAIIFKWYTVRGTTNDEVIPDERKLIDQGGNLHFSYVLKTDERLDSQYKCAISSIKANVIKLGNGNSLTVTSTGSIPNSAPRLQYSTSGSFLTVEVGRNATLECVFSGYVASSIPSETVPRVAWYDQDGRAITQGGRYDIVSNGRTLTIINVTEDDEKIYRCKGTNSLGAAEGSLTLNVTSRPVWVHRLEPTTVVEGKDAVLSCVTRSAEGEQSPSQPFWALNTNQMGSTYDPNKYQFSADKTTLTVKSVNKDRDIACFQCTVANSVGMVQDDGCVNVIKPIEIRVRPAAEQSVRKGDEVDLTVVASTDPLYAPNMTYSWIFKNVTYTGDKAPPYVTYDRVNNRAYINTSGLTDEEFKRIAGLYRRVISHPVETVYVDVIVEEEVENHTDCGSGSLTFTNTLLNRVLSKIEEQREVLRNVVHKLNEITLLLQIVGEDVLGTASMPESSSLPLTNEQEIRRLEDELMDMGFRTKLVQHLSSIGEDSVTSLSQRILKQLFSSELAQKYTFSGAKEETGVQSFQLRSVLIAAVRKTLAGTSEADVDGIVQKWFGNARDVD